MNTIESAKMTIINKLINAARQSTIHQEMIDELNKLISGANPRDIIGLRWFDLFTFDRASSELEYIALFNQLAIECN